MKEEILSIVTHALMGIDVEKETVDLIVEQYMINYNSNMKEIENWLIVNTSLEIEKIVDFKEQFMN